MDFCGPKLPWGEHPGHASAPAQGHPVSATRGAPQSTPSHRACPVSLQPHPRGILVCFFWCSCLLVLVRLFPGELAHLVRWRPDIYISLVESAFLPMSLVA